MLSYLMVANNSEGAALPIGSKFGLPNRARWVQNQVKYGSKVKDNML